MHIIQFKSIVDGNWFIARSRTYLFYSEAVTEMNRLRSANPRIEYRVI
nr:hypothetical protein 76 [Balneolaceae bacterium]